MPHVDPTTPSLSSFFQGGPSGGGGINSGTAGGISSIAGLLASIFLGPEVGLPLIGAGLDSAQAADRNARTDQILGAGLPGIEGAVEGLLDTSNRPTLPRFGIEQGLGRPGTAFNDIIQQLLPGLQQQGQLSGVQTDIGEFGRAIGGQIGGAQTAAQGLLSPERVTGILDPIRQQRKGVLQGGRISDPLSLGRDIISGVDAQFGTPQAQFGIASEAATRLARQNVAGLGDLEATKGTLAVAERNARLPIAAQAELSSARAEEARALFEGGILQASGAQGQDLNQRLTELEAQGFSDISAEVGAANRSLPGILANLAQTGSAGLLGLLGSSLEGDRLQSLIETLGFENALKLAGLEGNAAAGVEGDKTNLLNTLLSQGNIDKQFALGGQTTGIQALLNLLGISLGRPDTITPLGQSFTLSGQQLAANKAADKQAEAQETGFPFGDALLTTGLLFG